MTCVWFQVKLRAQASNYDRWKLDKLINTWVFLQIAQLGLVEVSGPAPLWPMVLCSSDAGALGAPPWVFSLKFPPEFVFLNLVMGSKCRCFHMLFHLKDISLNVFPPAQLNHLFEAIMFTCLVSSCSTTLLAGKFDHVVSEKHLELPFPERWPSCREDLLFLNVEETLGAFQNQEPHTSPRKGSSYPVIWVQKRFQLFNDVGRSSTPNSWISQCHWMLLNFKHGSGLGQKSSFPMET